MLREFSSAAYQSKEWSESTWYFPSEFTSRWFDDTFHKPEKLIEKGVINTSEWKTIEPFHDALHEIVPVICKDKFNNEPILLLDFGPWKEIQKKAGETLRKLNELGWSNITIKEH